MARFHRVPADDESIPGILASSVRLNVLERSSILWEDTGIAPRLPGFVQVMAEADLERMAAFVRCRPDARLRQRGEIQGTRASAGMMSFGSIRIERADVQLRARCIAPTTLLTEPYHLTAWLFTILPFCPVSLERLVEKCSICDVTLGWRRCWGIGTCEHCREQVPPSVEPPLPLEMAEPYRLFASMLSPVEAARRQAFKRLPTPLHDLDQGGLVTMAIRLGQLCRPDPIVGIRRESVGKMDAYQLASVVCTGISMVASWPIGFRTWANAELARTIHDVRQYHGIRKAIRRLGDGRYENATQAMLVRAALPTEFRSFARSGEAQGSRTADDVARLTGIKPFQMDRIRGFLEERRLPGIKRVRSQLHAGRCDEFVARYPGSVLLRDLTFRLRLPTYALEQMVCTSRLDLEPNVAVRLARDGICVTPESVADLRSDLSKAARRYPMPANAIALAAATRRIGGREKPWSSIVEALCSKNLPFWLASDIPTSRSIMVIPSSISSFDGCVFQGRLPDGLEFSDEVNRAESEELLNLPIRYLASLVRKGLLAFDQRGRGQVTSKAAVLALARRLVSPAELSMVTGLSHDDVKSLTSDEDIERIDYCWSRDDLIDRGIFPLLPTDVAYEINHTASGNSRAKTAEIT